MAERTVSMKDGKALTQRMLSGDESAFDSLYDRLSPAMSDTGLRQEPVAGDYSPIMGLTVYWDAL